MKVVLTNCIEITEPTKEVIDYCKKELMFRNPDYEKKKRMGFWIYGMDRAIKLYDEYNGKLYLPIGAIDDLYRIHPNTKDYVDYTVLNPIKIKSDIKLRDYQELAVPSVLTYMTGILNLPVGLGKTELALECVNRTKQKTLWITHTSDLVKQARERCESKMTCKTSTISEGKCDLSGDIVFATVQTLIKFIEKREIPQDLFGMIIVDECHRVSVNPQSIQMFRNSIEYFASRYKIGLSATVHRADGLAKAIEKIIGGIIYKIEKDENEYVCIYEGKELLRFPIDAFQVPAKIKVIETEYDIMDKPVFSSNGGTIQFASLISDLSMNEDRNKLIIKTLKSANGSTLVLSDRVEQLKYLCSQVDNGIQIDGGTPKKEREKALEDVGKGKYKYLFASYNLAKEGLNIPILSNLVMATPVKDFAIVSQSIGRIQRPYEGKKIAQVYDFVDPVGMLRRFYGTRRSTYVKNNWEVENIYLTKKIR